ncbi:MAG: GIY-YIG nuclease family protein [Pseudanabaenaceae cyanobacterium SKYGB_i_bin29]|nr:GIY-YIG nuclease family protein [Pseudanabaenaceae cyanobacterium SKYG29]MDW8420854.1 GIY-YIG nuclease family protein [Pseudanabaenaceae cyanobacterium SKYGB_i_bin29]
MIDYPSLASLPLYSYLKENGQIDEGLARKIGVYAIFNEAQDLVYVGVSRDIATSLKQHLVRLTDQCHFYKVWTADSWDAEDEVVKHRIIRGVARRMEEEIMQKLVQRGVKFEVKFHPKRREEGLLDLKLY